MVKPCGGILLCKKNESVADNSPSIDQSHKYAEKNKIVKHKMFILIPLTQNLERTHTVL